MKSKVWLASAAGFNGARAQSKGRHFSEKYVLLSMEDSIFGNISNILHHMYRTMLTSTNGRETRTRISVGHMLHVFTLPAKSWAGICLSRRTGVKLPWTVTQFGSATRIAGFAGWILCALYIPAFVGRRKRRRLSSTDSERPSMSLISLRSALWGGLPASARYAGAGAAIA